MIGKDLRDYPNRWHALELPVLWINFDRVEASPLALQEICESPFFSGKDWKLFILHWCVFLLDGFQVRVFVSLSHEEKSSLVHSPSALWAESINTVGFKLCARATGSTNDSGIINWLAFQDKPMLTHGSVTFSGIWTTQTKCDKVAFSQVKQWNVLIIFFNKNTA